VLLNIEKREFISLIQISETVAKRRHGCNIAGTRNSGMASDPTLLEEVLLRVSR